MHIRMPRLAVNLNVNPHQKCLRLPQSKLILNVREAYPKKDFLFLGCPFSLDFLLLILFFSGKMSGRGRVWEAGCAQGKAQLFDLRENFQFCALKSFYVIKRIIIFTLFSNLEMSQKLNLWMSDLQMCFLRWKLIELHISNHIGALFHLWKLQTRFCQVSEVP